MAVRSHCVIWLFMVSTASRLVKTGSPHFRFSRQDSAHFSRLIVMVGSQDWFCHPRQLQFGMIIL